MCLFSFALLKAHIFPFHSESAYVFSARELSAVNLAWTTNLNQECLISRKYWGERRLAIVSIYLVL